MRVAGLFTMLAGHGGVDRNSSPIELVYALGVFLCGVTMMRFKRFLWVAVLFSFPVAAQQDGLAVRPPMGWNSWNHFRNKVDDAAVRAQAEAMVSSGMRDAGYTYINIDDTWEGDRDSSGIIHTNSKFPDMKALADFV